MDVDTEWREVFDALTTAEQECIRDSVEGDLLESVLERPVMSETETPEAWEVSMFSCLAPQTARAVLLALLVAEMEEDGVIRIDAEAEACLDEWAAGIDVVATMVALSVDDGEAAREVAMAFMRCSPDLVVSLMLEETGLTLEDLGEEKATCLREWAAGTDWATLATGSTDVDLRPGLLDCAPDLLPQDPGRWGWDDMTKQATPVEIGVAMPGKLGYEDSVLFALEAAEGELYDLDVTLEDAVLHVSDADGTLLTSHEYSSLAPRAPFIWHAPATGTYYVHVASRETGTYTLTITIPDIVDDHPNSATNATPVEIGAATQSELEYEGDIDYFTFEATEGEYYELDVTLGTLRFAMLGLYDTAILNPFAATWPIASYGYSGEANGSGLIWRAPTTGNYYVVIVSFDIHTGAYTLTITPS